MGNLPSFNLNPARVDAEIKHFFDGFQMLHCSFIASIVLMNFLVTEKPFRKSFRPTSPICPVDITFSSMS